ncbi:hypothetical protein Tc00.1047053505655.20 [Trypanosoma cruzi]|uniref:Uncharacterized protein n=1 Tax=Trypanosoma cruzi (strain CL Brener) TaxID=353153 RepID=Q4CQD5_TRYCC|nr:uncharacterized protein Tc00.1047053505655.20 [Trypanosoma cruzi]EAN82486.1 hypothetical protein Tc00.1047053505655.20 [Trypanosoma cruzi]|eukprot:XP_804337.1 hypothetical protein Tc00.1047053505655.20 [Trypanosoma cruzi strain CL Brener]
MYCQRHGEGHGRGLSCPSSLCSQQILPILLLATPWVPQNAVKQSHVYGSPQCTGRGWQPHTLTLPHISSPTASPHTTGQRHGKGKPAAQRTQEHSYPRHTAKKKKKKRPQQERRVKFKSTALRFTSLFSDGLASHTHSEARRTPSAPLRVHSAGRGRAPSHPRAIAMGEQKQSSSRTITASSRKKEKKKWRHFNSTATRETLNGTIKYSAPVNTAKEKKKKKMNRGDLPKKKKKRWESRRNPKNIIKKGKIDSERRLSYAPRSTIQSCVCVCILPATRKKNQGKDFTVSLANTTFFTFSAASGLFFQSSFRAFRGTQSRGAGTEFGRKQK